MRTTRLRLTLGEVSPPVVRVIDVPATYTLPELHLVLQAALGWTESHLHQFVAGPLRYGAPGDDDWDGQQDEAGVRLKDMPARFTYLYDLGDGWEHDVEVLGPGEGEPGCRYGEGTCPPEDCGGPGGYADLLEALADPSHEEHEHMRDWVGNRLAAFDQAEADRQVRRMVGEVPASVRLVLDLAKDGVKLTPGGRLPRSVARAVQEQRPAWAWSERPVSIEDDLPPLSALHDQLRDVGLLRLHRGVLSPTKAASDDLEVVRRLRSHFPAGNFTTIVAEWTVSTLAATGPQSPEDLAAAVFPQFGHGWASDGQPLTEADVRHTIYHLSPLLRSLDLLEELDWQSWRAGPSARSLLPGTPIITACWPRPGPCREQDHP
ncbi:MAG: plasmid pRiA4b ORF-3 family protein [Mycobacteriales bacterium]